MAALTPENLPSDHRFREFQDNHYHDEDDHPGAIPPGDDAVSHQYIPAAKKRVLPKPPKRRRFEDEE